MAPALGQAIRQLDDEPEMDEPEIDDEPENIDGGPRLGDLAVLDAVNPSRGQARSAAWAASDPADPASVQGRGPAGSSHPPFRPTRPNRSTRPPVPLVPSALSTPFAPLVLPAPPAHYPYRTTHPGTLFSNPSPRSDCHGSGNLHILLRRVPQPHNSA